MDLTFTVKVRIGPRTKTRVVCEYSAKDKTAKLRNGKEITNAQIARHIAQNLQGDLRLTSGEDVN